MIHIDSNSLLESNTLTEKVRSILPILKSETFYLNSIDRTTTAIVERTVIEYEYYYNNIRIQTKLNNQSPINYRQLAV
ncbi:IS3 family transposase [Bacillus velezensis]|uniref:IS3 family transposase n=1 Tax=Bacillus velezensis TaxID=492670 RepID=UPI003D66D1D6